MIQLSQVNKIAPLSGERSVGGCFQDTNIIIKTEHVLERLVVKARYHYKS